MLAICVGAKEWCLVLLDIVVQPEVATSPPESTPEPRGTTKGDAKNAAHTKVRVLREAHADVEKDLLNARDAELGLDLGRGGGDLVDGLEDRGPGWNNRVASTGLVPVATVL